MLQLARPAPGLVIFAASVALTVSCAKARPDVTGAPRCASWKDDIGPLFASRCQSCHTGVNPAGRYDTSNYLGVLGNGSDTVSDAIAGEASSRLVTVLDPASADAFHRPFADLFASVRGWVVDCDVSYLTSSVHRGGILDPASTDFHGKLVRQQGYAFDKCQSCHGADYRGGTSRVSCLTCHADGPTACSTCHAAIATSGSHGRHLGGGPLGKSYGCVECHRVPTAYTDVGHIFRSDGSLDPPPAEVTLGATAALTPMGAVRNGPPAYDPATQSCQNVYCHGATLGDSAATHAAPVWGAAGTGQADCGSCHGLPPNHAGTRPCAACHSSVVDGDNHLVSPGKHIDGQIEFADPAAGCTGCHGGVAGPAPPRDLAGETLPAAVGVGAHQAHLTAPSHLRGPIACSECHRLPEMVTSAGHFSGHQAADPVDGAEVFPADPTIGRLASGEGAAPLWDRATATCSGVYCHGGGATLTGDTSIDQAPIWTSTGGLTCGVSCHGLPPAFSPHLPTMTRLDCSSCHPRTVDPSGEIVIAGPPAAETSAHINGVLDVAP